MNFRTFFEKLNDAENKRSVENAYSHIIDCVFDVILDKNVFSLIDTSTWKKGVDGRIVPKNIVATPDFVITDRDYKFNDNTSNAYGCIEVKYADRNVKQSLRLCDDSDSKGYLHYYQNVLYTNGWIWIYYDGKTTPKWTINFRENQTNKEFGRLLYELCSIEWKNLKVND